MCSRLTQYFRHTATEQRLMLRTTQRDSVLRCTSSDEGQEDNQNKTPKSGQVNDANSDCEDYANLSFISAGYSIRLLCGLEQLY